MSCFDEATNARLNRDRAREIALSALARHLCTEKADEFKVSGVQVEDAGDDGKYFTLTLAVPTKGVTVSTVDQAKSSDDRLVYSSEMFTRMREYVATLETLRATILSDLKTIIDKGSDQKDEVEALATALAELEKRCKNNFDNLDKEIASDLLLLSTEQESLSEALSKHRNYVLSQIGKARERHTVPKRRNEEFGWAAPATVHL